MSKITLSGGEISHFYEKLDKIEKILKHNAPITDDPVLTTEQVMSYLSVSRRSLQSWRDNSKIEYAAVNGKFYYRLSAINKMLNNHTVKMLD